MTAQDGQTWTKGDPAGLADLVPSDQIQTYKVQRSMPYSYILDSQIQVKSI